MIETFTTAYSAPGKLAITFTGTLADAITVEIDGVIQPLETTATGAAQTITVDVTNASRPMAIVLHEGASNILYPSRSRWGLPLVRWQALSAAYIYIIYHTAPGGSERSIYQVTEDGSASYEVQLKKELVDGWHSMRVEATDKYGRESTRVSWVFRVFQLPTTPGTVTAAAQGGGNYRIAIAE